MADAVQRNVFAIAAQHGFADTLAEHLLSRYSDPEFGLARLTLLIPNGRAGRAFTEALIRDQQSRSVADVLQNLGRPAQIERVVSFRGEVWTYRFLEMNSPRQAHLHIDPEGVVRRLMFTDELMRDDPPDRL